MEHNPLRQFFRRPSIYVTLPSQGKYYDAETYTPTESGEIPVYPMTTIDEVTSKTPDAVFSGQAVVDVIHSCVPNIRNAWKLNSVDLESVLIAIRIASSGENMEVTSQCPACENEANYDIDLVKILGTQKNIDYTGALKLNELEIKFKPLSFMEMNKNNLAQYDLQRAIYQANEAEDSPQSQEAIKQSVKGLNKLLCEMIANTIEWIKTPETAVSNRAFILEFIENCDKNTYNQIKDHSIKLKSQNELKPLHLKCENCQHQYEQNLVLDFSNFFD